MVLLLAGLSAAASSLTQVGEGDRALARWRGRGPRRFPGDDGDASSQTPLPPRFAWSPFPAFAGQDMRPRSRDASASELSLHAVRKPFPKPHSKKWREAKRRKAPLHRPRRRRQVYAVCANHLPCGARHAETDVAIRPRFGRARLSALHRGSRQRPESHRLSSRPCFLGRGSKRALPAFHLSQSRDCTSRAGRSTGVNDARSRPGAGRILRPVGLGSLALLYLLASPLGQMQFRRAESGASGQTTVTEDDVRRFIFPRAILKSVDKVAAKIEASRKEIMKRRRELDVEETSLWRQLEQFSI
jgi:hypothetical protein